MRRLREAGVYVTFDEYKGRSPIVRGDRVLEIDAHAFDNPLTSKAYEGATSGTTGRATRVETDLDNLMTQAPHLMMGRHVHDLIGIPMAVWYGSLPDPTGIGIYLRAVAYRGHPVKWFTPSLPGAASPALRFRLATAYVLAMSRLCGVPCPRPEPLPFEDAGTLARWARDAVARHGAAEVVTTVSLAVRVCLAANDAGIDLTGVTFFGGGEPFTAAKNASIRRAGARYVPIYIGEDTGPMGLSCVNPLEENDQHLLEDNVALITGDSRPDESGVEVAAFYLTSLRPQASKVLLNLESDDFGVVEERDCGCALQQLGYTTHVRRIRSFGKLTGEGVTLVGSDMVRVLEEILPRRFGASPQDFQLLEDADPETGLTQLDLIVSPTVQAASDEEILEAALAGLAQQNDAARLASDLWAQARTLRIRRAHPEWTARGKLLPIRRAPSAHPAPPTPGSS